MNSNSPPPSKNPHLPSFRGRYTLIVAVVSGLFTIIAALLYTYAATINDGASKDAAARIEGVTLLNDGFAQLYGLREHIHAFLLEPDEDKRNRLDTDLRQLESALTRLAEFTAVGDNLDVQLISQAVSNDAAELKRRIRELVQIRDDPQRWFPANRLVEEVLQPNNTQFVGTLDALIDATSDETERVIQSNLYALRKAWLRMADEMRLIIANRFGAYADDPLAGIAARARNLALYSEQIDRILTALRRQTADPLIARQVDELEATANAWRSAYHELYNSLREDDWRADLRYLEDALDPLLEQMLRRLDILRVELQTETRRQVDTLGGLGLRIGAILIVALGLFLVFGIIGFFTLDALILKPIRELASRLQEHAHQPQSFSPIPAAVQETQDLIDAFTLMRDQVQTRERELDHLAHHDTLTQLPNRARFRQRLVAAVAQAQRHDMLVGVLFIDLDRFKQVNDSHGHSAGDQMLKQISERLSKVFRQDDLVARLGGDEFAVMLPNLHSRSEMDLLANKALDAIHRPYRIDKQLFYSGASIGIAVAPDDSDDPDQLIRQADAAMYLAKRNNGSSFRYASDDSSVGAEAKRLLENALREAVHGQDLELHFQPVRAAKDGKLHCYESLLRWPHAERGLLHPASFMDAINDTGLCTQVSDWVLDHLQYGRPAPDAVVSMNLSARLLQDQAFADRLFERIDDGRLVGAQLIVEITEDTLESDLQSASRVLEGLKKRGVRIALDDFGSGQASLSHLRRFSFDYIKIDQSFISGIGEDENDEKLIQATVRLAHALDMQVVAEGVETAAQRDFLIAEQCDFLQGYLVGRPTPANQAD